MGEDVRGGLLKQGGQGHAFKHARRIPCRQGP